MIRRRSFQAIAFLAVTMIGLSGCASPGAGNNIAEDKFSEAYIRQHLIIGKTTEQDVVALYGPPTTRTPSSNSFTELTYTAQRTGTRGMLGTIAGVVPGVGMSNALGQYDDVADPSGARLFLNFKEGVLTEWSL